ncbi:arginase family protein [Embleya scabrispora]|uniref:arginase family protein n=1 Tax=Embleya scabrispora TaxID=159449 RepID=UPI0003A24372|nr:arginase family protein [Embleya scabrispora]
MRPRRPGHLRRRRHRGPRAPLDGGTSYRSGARFGPSAIRQACYLPQAGSRPSLALRVDALQDLKVYDAGDVALYSDDMAESVKHIEAAVFKIASTWDRREPLLHGRDSDEQLQQIDNGRIHGHPHTRDRRGR